VISRTALPAAGVTLLQASCQKETSDPRVALAPRRGRA